MPKKTNIELKPCPFCDGEAKITGFEHFCETRAYCSDCGSSTRNYKTEEEAANAWNNRPIQANATKGKWSVDKGYDVRDEKDNIIALVSYPLRSAENPDKTMKANARLIAATPELLKIVKALANSQLHQYSEIKMKASELLKSLEEVKND